MPKPPEPVIEKPDQREAEIALRRSATSATAGRGGARKQEEGSAGSRSRRRAPGTRNRAEGAGAQTEAERKQQARSRGEAGGGSNRRAGGITRTAGAAGRGDACAGRARDAIRAQAERESQLRAQAERESRTRAQAQRESQMRAQAEQEARGRAEQAAAGAARNKAQLDWIDRIRSRIRGYINLPPGHPGQSGSDLRRRPVADRGNHRRQAAQVERRSRVRRCGPACDPEGFTAPEAGAGRLFQRSLELHFRPLDQ